LETSITPLKGYRWGERKGKTRGKKETTNWPCQKEKSSGGAKRKAGQRKDPDISLRSNVKEKRRKLKEVSTQRRKVRSRTLQNLRKGFEFPLRTKKGENEKDGGGKKRKVGSEGEQSAKTLALLGGGPENLWKTGVEKGDRLRKAVKTEGRGLLLKRVLDWEGEIGNTEERGKRKPTGDAKIFVMSLSGGGTNAKERRRTEKT